MQRIFAFDEPLANTAHIETEPAEDFEVVVDRRQVAAITFLVLVVVALCSGGSYLAGKAISANQEPGAQEIQIENPPVSSPAQTPIPMIEATIMRAPAISIGASAPLFGKPAPQAIYIQVGAVEKGVAVVLAEGLRQHALDSFVAPGPGTKSFRVLIGPFADAQAYQKARSIVAEIGLDSFARRYQEQ